MGKRPLEKLVALQGQLNISCFIFETCVKAFAWFLKAAVMRDPCVDPRLEEL